MASAKQSGSKSSGSKSAGSKSNGAARMDAIALLKADHRAVLDMFEKYESARSEDRKQKLAQQICRELIVHAQIEEEIFYPAVRGEIEDDIVQEAYVEHDGAKVLITELLNGSPAEEFYDAKVMVLGEEIKHHIKEEEKRTEGMFAQARQAGIDMQALGDQLRMRKEELMAEMGELAPPPPMTRTFHAHIMQGDLPA